MLVSGTSGIIVYAPAGSQVNLRGLQFEGLGNGLNGMRERAELFGGKLEVWSKLGSGTQLELSIPGATAYDLSPGPPWWSKLLPQNGRRSRRN